MVQSRLKAAGQQRKESPMADQFLVQKEFELGLPVIQGATWTPSQPKIRSVSGRVIPGNSSVAVNATAASSEGALPESLKDWHRNYWRTDPPTTSAPTGSTNGKKAEWSSVVALNWQLRNLRNIMSLPAREHERYHPVAGFSLKPGATDPSLPTGGPVAVSGLPVLRPSVDERDRVRRRRRREADASMPLVDPLEDHPRHHGSMPKELKEQYYHVVQTEKLSRRQGGRTYTEMLDEEARRLMSVGKPCFTAYSCASPKHHRDISYKQIDKCSTVATGLRSRIAKVQVLREEQHNYAKGWRCSVVVSRRASYCGVYDHSTPMDRWSTVNIPVSLDPEQCRSAARTGKVTLGAEEHEVQVGIPNVFQVPVVGQVYVSNLEVKCQGGLYQAGGQQVDGAVVTDQYSIRIEEETFITNEHVLADDGAVVPDPTPENINDQTVTARLVRMPLPCTMSSGSCRTMEHTFVWQATNSECRLSWTNRKTIVGKFVRDQSEKIFMSTDGSLIRFVLKKEITKCDRTVWETNYPNFYVLELDKNSQGIEREIRGTEVDTIAYVNNRDDMLMHAIKQHTRAEFEHVSEIYCRNQQRRTKVDFYHQFIDPSLLSFLLNNATFGERSGEVIYIYHCMPTLVRPVTVEGRCFEALPVQVVNLTHPEHRSAGSSSADGQITADEVLFMQPITRRLLTTSAEVPCESRLTPKYAGIRVEEWFSGNDRVHPVKPPGSYNDLMPSDDVAAADVDHFDFSVGGLFSKPELDKWLSPVEYGNRVSSGLATLFREMTNNGWDGKSAVKPAYLVPASSLKPFHASFNPWSWLENILTRWGQGAAIFFSLVIIIGFSYRTTIACLAGKTLFSMYGCSKQLLWAFCPQTWSARKTFVTRARRPRHYENNEYDPYNDDDDDDRPGQTVPLRPIIRHKSASQPASTARSLNEQSWAEEVLGRPPRLSDVSRSLQDLSRRVRSPMLPMTPVPSAPPSPAESPVRHRRHPIPVPRHTSMATQPATPSAFVKVPSAFNWSADPKSTMAVIQPPSTAATVHFEDPKLYPAVPPAMPTPTLPLAPFYPPPTVASASGSKAPTAPPPPPPQVPPPPRPVSANADTDAHGYVVPNRPGADQATAQEPTGQDYSNSRP